MAATAGLEPLTNAITELACPLNCSARGACIAGVCHCDRFKYFDGPACDVPYNDYLGAMWTVWVIAGAALSVAVVVLAVYNLVSRVAFATARDRQRDRRRGRQRRCRCDLLMRISVLTVVGMIMKAVLVIDPFGSLGIFNNAVRTCLVRIPEVLGCFCLGMVVQVWASVATCVTGPSKMYLLSWLVNGGIVVLVVITLPAYFLMFIGVEPAVMTWVTISTFSAFLLCWFVGCIIWCFKAVTVLQLSVTHAKRGDQLQRFHTMLNRSVVFSRVAIALSLLLVATLFTFTITAVGPGNHPWWFLCYMTLMHYVAEIGFAALFCYFTLPVVDRHTTPGPAGEGRLRDYVPSDTSDGPAQLNDPFLGASAYPTAPATLRQHGHLGHGRPASSNTQRSSSVPILVRDNPRSSGSDGATGALRRGRPGASGYRQAHVVNHGRGDATAGAVVVGGAGAGGGVAAGRGAWAGNVFANGTAHPTYGAASGTAGTHGGRPFAQATYQRPGGGGGGGGGGGRGSLNGSNTSSPSGAMALLSRAGGAANADFRTA